MEAALVAPDQLDLVEALVEANDLFVSLVSLTSVANTEADWSAQVGGIVSEAKGALRADGVRVQTSNGARIEAGRCGTASDGCYLSIQVAAGCDDVVTLEAWRNGARFTSMDRRYLAAVTNLAASSTQRTALRDASDDARNISADHAAAARIARTVVPSSRHHSTIEGVSLFGATRPVQTAGGDFYTWVETDDGVRFAVGDVSGKGLAAAVLMTTVLNALEHAMRRPSEEDPVAIVESLNRWVYKHLSDAAMFVTVAVGSWRAATRTLEVVNAGHSPVLFASDGGIEAIPASIPPIGVLESPVPALWRKTVSATDSLIIGSDGLTEQSDWRGELFGEEAFAQAVQRLVSEPDSSAVAAELLRLVDAFAGPAPQSDDRTIMVFRVDDQADQNDEHQVRLSSSNEEETERQGACRAD